MFAGGHRLNAEGFHYWRTRQCTDTMTIHSRGRTGQIHTAGSSTIHHQCTSFSIVSFCTKFLTIWFGFHFKKLNGYKGRPEQLINFHYLHILYRGSDKSLARPGRKQATATEDFVRKGETNYMQQIVIYW